MILKYERDTWDCNRPEWSWLSAALKYVNSISHREHKITTKQAFQYPKWECDTRCSGATLRNSESEWYGSLDKNQLFKILIEVMIIHFIYRSYKIHVANFSIFQVFFVIVVITIWIWVIEFDSKRDNWPPSSSSNEIWSPCSLLFMTLSPCSLSSAGILGLERMLSDRKRTITDSLVRRGGYPWIPELQNFQNRSQILHRPSDRPADLHWFRQSVASILTVAFIFCNFLSFSLTWASIRVHYHLQLWGDVQLQWRHCRTNENFYSVWSFVQESDPIRFLTRFELLRDFKKYSNIWSYPWVKSRWNLW